MWAGRQGGQWHGSGNHCDCVDLNLWRPDLAFILLQVVTVKRYSPILTLISDNHGRAQFAASSWAIGESSQCSRGSDARHPDRLSLQNCDACVACDARQGLRVKFNGNFSIKPLTYA